jgi:pyruvate/2-oxoglutarate dehydrogenase complex dihydrolipoamide dehydrogenase (E3) component
LFGLDFCLSTVSRLGAKVILFHRHSHILNKEDADAAEIVQNNFIREGIELVLDSQMQRVEKTPEGKTLYYTCNGQSESVTVDEILIGAGRAPNVEGLNLEAVGVEYDRHGVKVNDYISRSQQAIAIRRNAISASLRRGVIAPITRSLPEGVFLFSTQQCH